MNNSTSRDELIRIAEDNRQRRKEAERKNELAARDIQRLMAENTRLRAALQSIRGLVSRHVFRDDPGGATRGLTFQAIDAALAPQAVEAPREPVESGWREHVARHLEHHASKEREVAREASERRDHDSARLSDHAALTLKQAADYIRSWLPAPAAEASGEAAAEEVWTQLGERMRCHLRTVVEGCATARIMIPSSARACLLNFRPQLVTRLDDDDLGYTEFAQQVLARALAPAAEASGEAAPSPHEFHVYNEACAECHPEPAAPERVVPYSGKPTWDDSQHAPLGRCGWFGCMRPYGHDGCCAGREPAAPREDAPAPDVLARIAQWTREHGASLKPIGADSFGEGMREAKRQIAAMLRATPAAPPATRDESVPPPGWYANGPYCARARTGASTPAAAWAIYDAEHGYAPTPREAPSLRAGVEEHVRWLEWTLTDDACDVEDDAGLVREQIAFLRALLAGDSAPGGA